MGKRWRVIGKEHGLVEIDPKRAVAYARGLVFSDPDSEDAARQLNTAVKAFRLSCSRNENKSTIVDPPHPLAPIRILLDSDRDEEAEIALRQHLKRFPDDPEALVILADIAVRCGFPAEAEPILKRALELDPSSNSAIVDLAKTYHRLGRADESLASLGAALELNPSNEIALSFKAAVLVQIRRLDSAVEAFEALVAAHPHQSRGWMNFAFLLKTIGRLGEAIAAYRTAIALDPLQGGAWWGMANLKIARFFSDDSMAMTDALANQRLDEKGRIEIHFALGKALDAAGEYDAAFAHLEQGNRLRLAMHPYDRGAVSGDVDRTIGILTPSFLKSREGWGNPSRDPIFIVGMPRSGSTLVEQILASHPLVEGTEELFHVQRMVGHLCQRPGSPSFPNLIAQLSADECASLGRNYLSETRAVRRTERPRFTDKMPGNWVYAGLIHLMLPKAKIIDVRRHPFDCCIANFAQHFQWGMNFTYGLADLGNYYREYIHLMRHLDDVLPGRIHRIIYEDLVEDTETQVRRLLDHLGLPFEESCLRFFETERPVHTPSSEQVRQPINRAGMERWRNYAAWLKPLQDELGDLPTTYRA